MADLFELMIQEQQYQMTRKIIACNEITGKYGLALTEDDVKTLMTCRKDTMKEQQRVEFGEGILPDLIYAFCDSEFIDQENYTETLSQLQEAFYFYKNESMDELTDSELIEFMRRQFDEVCFGDIEYLKGTCLERFSRAIRSGYESQMQHRLRDEYALRQPENDYAKFDEEVRWEYELFKLKLEELF